LFVGHKRFALLFIPIIVASIWLLASTHGQTLTRHTISRLVSLVHYDVGPGDVWVTYTYTRSLWIQADGSGRIEERFEPVGFPTPTEAEQWQAAGTAEHVGTNKTFGSKELSYLTEADIRSGIAAIGSQSSSQGVASMASLLAETVPTRTLVESAFDAVRLVPRVIVVATGATAEVSGTSDDPFGTRISVTVDTAGMRFLSECRVATEALPGLELKPPIVMFSRQILVSELLDDWHVTEQPSAPFTAVSTPVRCG
jgi:hypothetical protein